MDTINDIQPAGMIIANDSQNARQGEFDNLINSITKQTPLLLFPLRIETHFRGTGAAQVNINDVGGILDSLHDLVNNLDSHRFDEKYNFQRDIAKLVHRFSVAQNVPDPTIVTLTELTSNVFSQFSGAPDEAKYAACEETIRNVLSGLAGDDATKVAINGISPGLLNIRKGSAITAPVNRQAVAQLQNITPGVLRENRFKLIDNPEIANLRKMIGRHIVDVNNQAEHVVSGQVINSETTVIPDTDPVTAKLSPKELCVRIFPDEIFIDYLTEQLTEDEINAGKKFWIQWYIASGSKKREYEAWQVLCTKYNVQRAAWIVRQMKPENINDFRIEGELYYRRPYPKMAIIERTCEFISRNLAKIVLDENESRYEFTGEYMNEYKIRKYLPIIRRYMFRIEGYLVGYEFIVDYLFDHLESTMEYLSRRLDSFLAFYDKYDKYPAYGNNPRLMELWDVDYTTLKTFRKDIDDFLEKLYAKRIPLDEMIQKYLDLDEPKNNFFPSIDKNTSGKPNAPVSYILPERFVFIGVRTNKDKTKKTITQYGRSLAKDLKLGLTPGNDYLTDPVNINENGDLEIPEGSGLSWMTDYDEAVKAGLGITVPLDDATSEPYKFDYIYVLGVKNTDTSKKEEQQYLQNLFNSHNYISGLEMLKPGTPTNLVDGGKPSYCIDPAKEMKLRYDIEVDEVYNTAQNIRYDSMKLSKILNLDYGKCWGHAINYDNHELYHAEKAYALLWKHFSDNIQSPELKNLLEFIGGFLPHVKARGMLPAFRIGLQPYGILPVTDFMKMKDNIFLNQAEDQKQVDQFQKLLIEFLKNLTNDKLLHQLANFLDQLLLKQKNKINPFYIPLLTNLNNFLKTLQVGKANTISLPDLGAKKFRSMLNEILSNLKINRLFIPNVQNLFNFLISLRDQWEKITETSVVSQESLQSETDSKVSEQKFLEMAGMTPYSTTFYERQMISSPLLSRFATVPGNFLGDLKSGEYFEPVPVGGTERELSFSISSEKPLRDLFDLVGIIKSNMELRDIPDEECRLLVSEFIDLFTHRLDAWFTGILDYLLQLNANLATPKIGAYGWVFNLEEDANRSKLNDQEKQKALELMKLPQSGDYPVYKDPDDEYIVAPSIQHALSAAILRSAYLKSKNSGDSHLCVNLSSMRVRQALRILSGIRAGMSTGIILGADLERYLHEASRKGLEMDKYIYPLRQLFPQTVDLQAEDKRANDYVMHVINGEALLNTILNNPKWDSKKTLSSWLGSNCTTLEWYNNLNVEQKHQAYLFKLIERLMDSYDALNDLLLAEGVHRLVQDDRASFAAVSQFMKDGNGYLPDPAVLDSPMEYVVVSHKVAIALPEYTKEKKKKDTKISSMCLAEPSVNLWLEQLMGSMDNISFWVEKTDSGNEPEYFLTTLNALGIAPIEYLYLSNNDVIFYSYLEACWRLNESCFTGKVTIYPDKPDKQIIKFTIAENVNVNDANSFSLYENELRINCLRSLIMQGAGMTADDWVATVNSDAENETAVDMEDMGSRYLSLYTNIKHVNDEMLDYLNLDTSQVFTDETLAGMYQLLCRCVESGMVNSLPEFNPDMFPDPGDKVYRINPIIERLAFDKAVNMQQSFIKSFADIQQQLDARLKEANIDTGQATSSQYIDAMKKLLLDSFKIFPLIKLPQLETYKDILDKGIGYYENIGDPEFEEWQSDVAEVRERMQNLHRIRLFENACNQKAGKVSILQMNSKGVISSKKWLGCEVEAESELENVDSLVIYNSKALNTQSKKEHKVSGIIVDSWIEYIPYMKHSAGMVFRCEQPENEAPQALLLALHPGFNINSGINNENNRWTLEYIRKILDETRSMLMNRAVEPDLIYNDKALSSMIPLLSTIEIPQK